MAVLSLAWILRRTVATVFTLLAGVALMALAAFLVATVAPDGVRDLRAYEAAPRCPAAPSGPAECRWTQEFTVSGVRLTKKRSESNRAFLTGPDGARWETFYSSNGPVLDGLGEGDRVTGTVWRGLLTEISAGGTSQETHDAPADMRARVLILALIVVPSGLLMTVATVWRLCRRRAAAEPTPGMRATLGLGFSLFFAGLFSPLLLGGRGENVWLVAAVWLPIAAVMAIMARAYATRKPDAQKPDAQMPAA
ncbi:hypothetical protein GCM10023085_08660 [Actinomadura viridis]|uniref:Uncharacterized protein n=1 Tax=Actinomadura viridis TaxID=58110 RepID=A0A931GLT5_9ACTN|nr:hypothetical protein [Actinomadura viridis]MBG6091877.1 hypothetical protein [Actinomadura viridis]